MLQNRANIFSYVQAQTILTDWIFVSLKELYKKYFPVKRSTFFSEFCQIFQNSFFCRTPLGHCLLYLNLQKNKPYKNLNRQHTMKFYKLITNSSTIDRRLSDRRPIYCTRKEMELNVANYNEIKIRTISSKNQLQTSRN